MPTHNEIQAYWEHCTPLRDESWTYDKLRDFRYNVLQTYQLSTIRFDRFSGMKVLEVGCGAGIDALEFARHGADVTATDITEDALRLTHRNALQARLPLTIVKLSEGALPFEDKSFDVVYSFGVLHHIPEIRKVLLDIKRVLKSGGTFICMVYNRSSILYQYSIIHLHELENLTEEELISRYSERNIGCPYTKAYTVKEVCELMGTFFTYVAVSTRYNVLDLPNRTERKVKLQLPEGHPLGWHLIAECVND